MARTTVASCLVFHTLVAALIAGCGTSNQHVVRIDSGPDLPGFVYIEPGTFKMGSPNIMSEPHHKETEHWVSLTNGFWLSETEITMRQYLEALQWAYDNDLVTIESNTLYDHVYVVDKLSWKQFQLGLWPGEKHSSWRHTGEPPMKYLARINLHASVREQILFDSGAFTVSDSIYLDHPVTRVSWLGAVRYCDWINLRMGVGSIIQFESNPYRIVGYRLPTESEWEYACRAGTTTPFYTGDCLECMIDANCSHLERASMGCPGEFNRSHSTLRVKSLPPNPWGLYEMPGNAREWCWDYWYPFYPSGTQSRPVIDPSGPTNELSRVIRGGGHRSYIKVCRSAARGAGGEFDAPDGAGFRVAITAASAPMK